MKRLIKAAGALLYVLWRSIANSARRLRGIPRRPSFVVLYYHAVPEARRERFVEQVTSACHWASVLPAGYTGELSPRGRYVAFTFDDAFISVAETAIPVLSDRGCVATVFVPFAWCGRAPGWEMEAHCPDRSERVMTTEELRALPTGACRLGSHSMTHARLPGCNDRELETELSQSLNALDALPGLVRELACPYGAVDARVTEACRRLGYTRVYSIDPACASSDGSDYVRGRVAVSLDDTTAEFALKVFGGYEWLSRWQRLGGGWVRGRAK